MWRNSGEQTEQQQQATPMRGHSSLYLDWAGNIGPFLERDPGNIGMTPFGSQRAQPHRLNFTKQNVEPLTKTVAYKKPWIAV